ncbi:MAG: hypothetical protein HPZ91_05680 [Lentisphaeria bacterium]|nr:hypothetical protein [Lentisphaeria bacterium]
MAKNDFISDNLVHMRERLKENAARAGAPASPAREEAPPGTEPAPKLSDRLPMRQTAPRGDDLDRQRRDFEYRLERDRAAIAAELELESQRAAELERFSKALDGLDAEFRRLGSGEGAEFQREFEKLRFAYYRAAGRASAFLKEKGGALASPADGERPSRRGFAVLPIAAALIISSLIIAVTLFLLFH